LVAGAALVEGVYMAKAMFESNEFVTEAMKSGVANAVVLRPCIPGDAAEWVKANHNSCNSIGGSTATFVEIMEQVKGAEASWKSKCDVETITVDGCPKKGPCTYAEIYSNHVLSKCKGHFSGWGHCRAAKGAVDKATNHFDVYAVWKAFCESNCNFLCSRATKQGLAEIHSHIMFMMDHFVGSMPEWFLKEIVLHLLKMATPIDPREQDAATIKYSNVLPIAVVAKTECMLSVAQKRKQDVAGDAAVTAAEHEGDQPGPAKMQKTGGAKKGRGKGKSKPNAAAVQATVQGNFSTAIGGEKFTREKLFLDDLAQALLAPVRPLDERGIQRKEISNVALDALIFALRGTITLSAKELKAWSKAREALQNDVVKSHMQSLSVLATGVARQKAGEKAGAAAGAPDLSSEDAAQSILDLLNGGLVHDDYEAPPQFHPALEPFLGNYRFALQFRTEFMATKDVPVAARPRVLSMMAAVAAELPGLSMEFATGVNNKIPMGPLLELFSRQVCTVYDDKWSAFGSAVAGVAGAELWKSGEDAMSPEDVSAGIFDSWAEIDACFRSRAQLQRILIKRLMSGAGSFSDCDLGGHVAALERSMGNLVAVELKVTQNKSIEFWTFILQSAPSNIQAVLLQSLQRGGDAS
ncbi:unnamed protein product, partial [Prorocentrum cordatum]